MVCRSVLSCSDHYMDTSVKINRAHSADNILDDSGHDDDDDDDDDHVDIMSPPPKPPLDMSVIPTNLLSLHGSVLQEFTHFI